MGQYDYLQGTQEFQAMQGVQGVDGVPSGGGVRTLPAVCCVEWSGECYDTPFLDYWVLEAACVDMMNGTIHMYKTCADKPCG